MLLFSLFSRPYTITWHKDQNPLHLFWIKRQSYHHGRSEVRDEQEGLPAGSLEYNISRKIIPPISRYLLGRLITFSFLYAHCCFMAGFKNFSLSELKASTKDLSNDRVIGRGGFVTVYKVHSFHVLFFWVACTRFVFLLVHNYVTQHN